MPANDLFFVIPTYRLREVGETVEHYDEHFWCNGHSVHMIVFDDSSPANQEKYYPLLEQTQTHHDLFYVGPQEKEQFLAYLNQRLRDKRLEGLVKNLFRPSYGGNRNFTLTCQREPGLTANEPHCVDSAQLYSSCSLQSASCSLQPAHVGCEQR